MSRYIFRRLGSLIFVLIGMSIITFIISHVIPSDPAWAVAGPEATAEAVEEIRRRMGLDRPLPEQYWRYVTGLVLRGDLGESIRTYRPVADDIKDRLPASIELAGVSFLIALPTGVLLGITSARRAGRLADAFTRLFAILGVSMPVFVLAMLIHYIFYFRLGWFPGAGRIAVGVGAPTEITGFYLIDSVLTGNWRAFVSALRHIALPALTLATASLAIITRMTRSSMLEVLHQDYIRTARSKGLTERVVLWRHALKNVFVPVLTVVGLQLAALIAWAFLVELIFSWPGIGSYAAQSILAMDFQPIMAITLVFSVIYVSINLVVDILYMFLDPRIRY